MGDCFAGCPRTISRWLVGEMPNDLTPLFEDDHAFAFWTDVSRAALRCGGLYPHAFMFCDQHRLARSGLGRDSQHWNPRKLLSDSRGHSPKMRMVTGPYTGGVG